MWAREGIWRNAHANPDRARHPRPAAFDEAVRALWTGCQVSTQGYRSVLPLVRCTLPRRLVFAVGRGLAQRSNAILLKACYTDK